MTEMTFVGNVSKIRETINSKNGKIFVFDIAIEDSYWSASRGERVNRPPVFKTVNVFRKLADNAERSIRKGMRVTVVGKLVNANFTPNGSQYPVVRDKIEASDVSVSLLFTPIDIPTSDEDAEAAPGGDQEMQLVA